MSYAAICIGIFIFIVAYFTLNIPAPGQGQPLPSAQPIESVAFCQDVTEEEIITFTAPRDENTKCPDGPDGSYKSGGVDPDNIFAGQTTYRLIKKNVPLNRSFFTKEDGSDHSTLASDAGIETSLDPNKHRLYFPQISGEINLNQAPYSRTRDCGDRSYQHTGRMYFIDYGLAFGLVLKDGQPIEVRGQAIGGGNATFWLTDVFKDIEREDQIPPEAFACTSSNGAGASAAPQGLAVTFPNQQRSTDSSQLQLEYFVFGFPSSANQIGGQIVDGWVDTCKPAIYLYPPKKQLVNVKVHPQGYLSYVDPPYDKEKGWTVWANPDGNLYEILKPKKYDYLYYESKIKDQAITKPTQGWIKTKSELNALYKEILPKLGLNGKQQSDFIEYWNKALPDSPYYFIGILDPQNIDHIEKLEISPEPDYITRVRIYFELLDSPKTVQAPNLNKFGSSNLLVADRPDLSPSAFKAVEWGGLVKTDPTHPFTCSQ